MTAGITSWGAYIPAWRLSGTAVRGALGASARSTGQRSVASYDEDTTSMAVEASRFALRSVSSPPDVTVFSTIRPPYADKTNATALRAALNLPDLGSAFDMNGAARSAIGAFEAGLAWAQAGRSGLIAIADMHDGLPGSADETGGGDGAAAFVLGTTDAVVEVMARGSRSREFLDRWRTGSGTSSRWEERFGEHGYSPLGRSAVHAALDQARLDPVDVQHVIVAGPHERASRALVGSLGCRPEAVRHEVAAVIGNAGAAQGLLELCAVLDHARPGETILFVSLADGADAILLRTTDDLLAEQARRGKASAPTVTDQLTGTRTVSYPTFLTWRGRLVRETPRRPEPPVPAPPAALRTHDWKFGFVASRCDKCQTRHLPPARICVKCRAADRMAPESLAGVPATIATYTVDRLAYSLSPPVVSAVIDFDGGGRFTCELTDIDPDEVRIGLRVQMTFRRLYESGGVHNYFWKAKPVSEPARG